MEAMLSPLKLAPFGSVTYLQHHKKRAGFRRLFLSLAGMNVAAPYDSRLHVLFHVILLCEVGPTRTLPRFYGYRLRKLYLTVTN